MKVGACICCLSYACSSGVVGVSSTIGTSSGAETLESGVDRGDPTVGSGESSTFLSTVGVATDGSITGSPNELLSKLLGNECSISATVLASGKLTHSTSQLVEGLRLNAGSTAGRKLLLLREFLTFVLCYCL